MGKIKALLLEIEEMLVEGYSYPAIMAMTGCRMEDIQHVDQTMDQESEDATIAYEAASNS
jgi:uncharacterized protein YerC